MEKQVPSKFDIIGDVHGHCDALEALLRKMGYRNEGSCYRHPDRTAIFVGDLIDRGPKVRETLELVKSMEENGAAMVTLGNHEYNALCFCSKDSTGRPLREHSDKNCQQFLATSRAFLDHADEWEDYLEWFKTLPLFIDLREIRVVHACWSQRHIDWVGDRRLDDLQFLRESAKPGTPDYKAVETILKGPEVSLPPGTSIRDKEGNIRTKTRVKWWEHLEDLSLGLASLPEQESLSKLGVDQCVVQEPWDVYSPAEPPVFVGHYWLPPQSPRPFGNVVCLDYSVAKGGFLAAYRWNRGEPISNRKFVKVTPESYA